MQDEKPENLTAVLIDKLLGLFLVPLLVGIGLLVFEYAILQPITQNPNRPLFLLTTAFVVSLLLNYVVLIIIRLQAHRYVRETYALYTMTALLLTVLTLGVMLSSGYLPWYFPSSMTTLIRSGKIERPVPNVFEIALLLLGSYIVLTSLWRSHSHWRGCKSVEQVQREENRRSSHLIIEAYAELRRIIRRKQPFKIYRESPLVWTFDAPDEPIESQSWKDQARELVSLVSTTYAFRRDASTRNHAQTNDAERGDWHDLMACWIGTNMDTGDVVVIIPTHTPVDKDRLKAQIAYAQRISNQRQRRLAEIIVAVKDGTVPPTLNLGRQVRVETEHTLLERTINLEDYRNSIEQRVRRHHLPASTLTILDTYVSMLGKVGDVPVPVDVETYIRTWLIESGRRQLALIGNYGMGKSTLSLMLTYKLLSEHQRLPPRIPILIELRGRLLRNLEPEALLGQWAARYGMNGKALLRLHEAGRLLLLFEGFDEMAYLSDREMRLSYFRALWEFARYPAARILVTGRQTLFETEEEKSLALRLQQFYGQGAYSEPIELQPFTIEQITEALRAFQEHVRTQIVYFATESARFRDIVMRPSLLHVVATIWDEAKLAEQARELSSATVLEAFVQSTYHRQTEKELKPGEFMLLTSSDRAYFMSSIATYMAAWSLTTINGQELTRLTVTLINEMPTIRKRITDPATGETDQRKLERVKTEVRSSTLLDDDPTLPDSFKFGHKSFLEFLFAEVIANSILHPNDERIKAIMRVTGATENDVFSIPEAVAFLGELLIRNDSELRKQISGPLVTANEATCYMVAERMLECITRSWYQGRLRRFVLFVTAIWVLLSLVRSFVGLIMTGLLLLPTIMIIRLGGIDVDIRDPVFLVLIIPISFVSTELLSRYIFKPLVSMNKKIELWSRICTIIGISDDIQHQVIGTAQITWLRKRAFKDIVVYSKSKSQQQP